MFLGFENVTLRFSGLVALHGVTFEIPQNGIFAVIGPNGAGKTTLLNCLSRFYTPQEGQITFEGNNILKRTANEMSGLGLTRSFQNIELFKRLSVEENLLIGLHHRIRTSTFAQALQLPSARRAESAARAQVQDVMEQLGLSTYAKHTAGQLPYGVQKRVDIGRALVSGPKVLLLDEPAAGMNEAETEALGDWIAGLPEKTGVTVVMVEHDMSLVMRITHRIAVLDFGKLIAVGPPDEIRNHPDVIEAYLGKEDVPC